ncbi:unnamed protein product [Euphydryas editha]|uniref:Uncharacterized protein n=1 Tax=Euphydryas editha TaxID=104508 RepID=A0AAU9ULA5_EUPED|nr:unnamed protein product [Euphydryas editha]
MAFIGMRSSMRILWVGMAMVFLTRCSAAPAVGETNKAMCRLISSDINMSQANTGLPQCACASRTQEALGDLQLAHHGHRPLMITSHCSH